MIVDEESVAIRGINGNRQENRTVVGETMASVMQLVGTASPDVTVKIVSPQRKDWGTITVSAPVINTSTS